MRTDPEARALQIVQRAIHPRDLAASPNDPDILAHYKPIGLVYVITILGTNNVIEISISCAKNRRKWLGAFFSLNVIEPVRYKMRSLLVLLLSLLAFETTAQAETSRLFAQANQSDQMTPAVSTEYNEALKNASARELLQALKDKMVENPAGSCSAGYCFNNCPDGYSCTCLTLSDGTCRCGDCLKNY